MAQIRNARLLALTGAVLSLAGGVLPARAQDPDDLKRGVARLSLMNGEVSVRRGDSGEWVAGVINAPLLTDDHVATGPNSRAEVQFDASNVLRIGANGELRLTQLEYGRSQMELARGVMTYRVQRNVNSNIEIDTPSLSVRPSREGSVRISVNEAGETEVTARGGDVEIFTPHGSQWVRNGQTLMARGAATDAEFQVVNAGGMDEWDRWSDSRDRMITQSVSSRYVGQGVYGAEDLDNSGSWTNVPEYGNVWHPTAVAADWAPYQSGRWVWEDWYGWTWVSYDPWGWAPYHYGRWFHQDRIGWCWYPGMLGARHYWSPALVGFIGFGNGGGVGFGFGNVGWVPLAPYEVFHPWWGRGFNGRDGFNRNVNITNINVTNVYRNSRVNNGVNAVGFNDFQSGRFNNVARMNGNQIREAGAVRGQMPFAPGNANMRFTERQAGVVPRSTENARFFTHQQPTPVQRIPMNGTNARMQANPQGSPQGGSGQPIAQPNAIRGGQPATGSQDGNGWRRFGSPSVQPASPQTDRQGANPQFVNRNAYGSRGEIQRSAPPQNNRPAPSPQVNSPQVNQPAAPRNDTNRGGWQRFGSPAPAPNNAPAPRQNAPAPRQDYRSSPYNDRPQPSNTPSRGNQYNAPDRGAYNRQESLRITPPVVRERPSYNAPRQSAPSYSAPSYSAPRQSAPSYSAPRQSAPSYSAPRQSAPSYSSPRQSAPSNSAPRQSAPSNNGSHGNSGSRSR